MAKPTKQEEKEIRKSRGNTTKMKKVKNLDKTLSLWGQFFHRLP
jgi:hypothetical protein